MTPQEMKQLAELLQNVPGIKSVDLKDVKGLAQLLRESPEIGSIEVKGWFGTGVVITRTGVGTGLRGPAPRTCRPRPRFRRRAAPAEPREAARSAPALKEIRRRWSARSTRRRSPAPIPT